MSSFQILSRLWYNNSIWLSWRKNVSWWWRKRMHSRILLSWQYY